VEGRDGHAYVAISQRHRTKLVLVRLVAGSGNSVGFEQVDSLALPRASGCRTARAGLLAPRRRARSPRSKGWSPTRGGDSCSPRRRTWASGAFQSGVPAFAAPQLIDRVREFGQEYTREFDEEEFVCEIDESSPSAGSD
jgi:hypothetical protein